MECRASRFGLSHRAGIIHLDEELSVSLFETENREIRVYLGIPIGTLEISVEDGSDSLLNLRCSCARGIGSPYTREGVGAILGLHELADCGYQVVLAVFNPIAIDLGCRRHGQVVAESMSTLLWLEDDHGAKSTGAASG